MSKLKKNIKLIRKRGLDTSRLEKIIEILAYGDLLSARYKDHCLVGNWAGHRECHTAPDWLLIYKISNNELFISKNRHA